MKFEKTSCCTFIISLVAVILIAPLCHAGTSSGKTSIEEVKQETQDLIQTLKAYSADQRDEAIQKTKSVLENIDQRIDALETRIDNNWDRMNRAAREKARKSKQGEIKSALSYDLIACLIRPMFCSVTPLSISALMFLGSFFRIKLYILRAS